MGSRPSDTPMGGSSTHIWSEEHLSFERTTVSTANHGTWFYSTCELALWPYSGTVLYLSYSPMLLVITGRPSWPLTNRTGFTKVHTSYATDDSPTYTGIISRGHPCLQHAKNQVLCLREWPTGIFHSVRQRGSPSAVRGRGPIPFQRTR